MNLAKKKALAAKTLGVGKNKIMFNSERLQEIKEAITRQDIKDLYQSRAIVIKEINGRRTKVRRKTRRRYGSIKKKVNVGKRKYLTLTRKLRAYIKELCLQEKISKDQYRTLRKQIRASVFRSKGHLKEILSMEKK
jgi:large subunit ribosomal protein L19e